MTSAGTGGVLLPIALILAGFVAVMLIGVVVRFRPAKPAEGARKHRRRRGRSLRKS